VALDAPTLARAELAVQIRRRVGRDPAVIAPEAKSMDEAQHLQRKPYALGLNRPACRGVSPHDRANIERSEMQTETATFAAGCFWGVEAAFRALPGVTRTTVGYTGGDADHPTYKQVCRGRTGHAEAVEVEYDPTRISYDDLLAAFWSTHNPTTRDRQGWDIGSQYRSAVFFHGNDQRAAALASRDDHQNVLTRQIVTQIVPAERFWPAEDYHQQYLEKRGQASCAISLGAA
jgi:peptide-methionine (S)-S-oxide reductase